MFRVVVWVAAEKKKGPIYGLNTRCVIGFEFSEPLVARKSSSLYMQRREKKKQSYSNKETARRQEQREHVR